MEFCKLKSISQCCYQQPPSSEQQLDPRVLGNSSNPKGGAEGLSAKEVAEGRGAIGSRGWEEIH